MKLFGIYVTMLGSCDIDTESILAVNIILDDS